MTSPPPSRLPSSFLRSLEADLRALCADARRANPSVKQAAERSILLLKEADDAAAELAAADHAAAVFCSACQAPESSPLPSPSKPPQVGISLRAVSCLHRLITHRALAPPTLPVVLQALQRLCSPCFDDTVTLKVLQSLLSLLTVRAYTRSLSEIHLSRAFSMLFHLRSIRAQSNSNPASTALSAISHFSAHSPALERGVIEHTANAAFRQISSDLFAAAADATVRTAVERHAPYGQFIPLAAFPSEATAAFNLFLDLCHAIAAEPSEWLSTVSSEPSQPLDVTLALEVIDDSLATNISLFAGQPVFSELVLARLCPAVHKLLHTTKQKSLLKSLLSLIVTLVRNYWRNLQPDAETFCYTLTNMAAGSGAEADRSTRSLESWSIVYAIEALRCIFRSTPNESSPLIDFVRTFDLGKGAAKCISGVIVAGAEHISLSQSRNMQILPPSPITATMKPFAKLIANSTEFMVSISIGLHVEVVKAADDAVRNKHLDVATVLMPTDTTASIVVILATLMRENSSPSNLSHMSAADQKAQMTAFQIMLDTIVKIAAVSDACKFERLREKAITTLCSACAESARSKPSANQVDIAGKQLKALFNALFDVATQCKTGLGRLWEPVIDALHHMDALHEKISVNTTDRDAKVFASSAEGLGEKTRALMSCSSELPWHSCHDLVSALVRCSRLSVAQMSKNNKGDDSARLSADSGGSVRLFGIAGAEIAILSALRRPDSGQASEPSALWQLVTGHLTSICVDTASQPLRLFALASLTKIACGALQGDCHIIIAHERIVRPFLDLLSSPYADVHSGTLSSVYSILEKHGEHLKGDSAWRIILQILSIATGTRVQRNADGHSDYRKEELALASGTPVIFEPSPETVSDGFKLVQFIADDFLSSITKSSFPLWLDLLRLCSSQVHDVNVALTSIGLMWRTADFLAKVGQVGKDDELWVALFQALKEVSMDDRPEIRNCAVKTLTGALSAHSSRLSAVAWNSCVEKALLPLLEEVMQGGSTAVAAEEEPPLAKSRSDVQLLLHHSRDTPRKQWNETRVLALAGVAKLLRTAMPRLSVLTDEDNRPLFMMLTDGGTGGLWRKMLRAAGVAGASRDGEVAVAGVSALLELLDAAGLVVERPSISAPELRAPPLGRSSSSSKPAGSSFWIPSFVATTDSEESRPLAEDPEVTKRLGTVSLWESVWCALSEATGGRQLMRNDSSHKSREKKLEVVDEKALRILSEGLISARKRLADKFTPSSSRVLVEVLMVLSLGRQATNETAKSSGIGEGVSQVQDVTLQGLEELSFGNDEASWSALIEGMLGIVSRENISRGNRYALSTRLLKLLSRMYRSDETPAAVKASQTANVLRVLGKIMVSSSAHRSLRRNLVNIGEANGLNAKEKEEECNDPLWIQATEVVIIAMKQGSGERGANVNDEVWQEFGKLVTDMLFKERKRGYEKNYNVEERERREVNDMRLVECVKDGLSRMGSNTSPTTKQDLVRILARGAEEGHVRGRPRFVRGCQKKLFQLADGAPSNRTHVSIKEESGKCVVETCSRVLGQYNADGHRAGKCPLPAGRRAEAVFLLQQLRKMRRTDGWAQHLTCLYSRLCECVDSRDEAVRWLAKELLDESAPVTQEKDVNKGEFRTMELRA